MSTFDDEWTEDPHPGWGASNATTQPAPKIDNNDGWNESSSSNNNQRFGNQGDNSSFGGNSRFGDGGGRGGGNRFGDNGGGRGGGNRFGDNGGGRGGGNRFGDNGGGHGGGNRFGDDGGGRGGGNRFGDGGGSRGGGGRAGGFGSFGDGGGSRGGGGRAGGFSSFGDGGGGGRGGGFGNSSNRFDDNKSDSEGFGGNRNGGGRGGGGGGGYRGGRGGGRSEDNNNSMRSGFGSSAGRFGAEEEGESNDRNSGFGNRSGGFGNSQSGNRGFGNNNSEGGNGFGGNRFGNDNEGGNKRFGGGGGRGGRFGDNDGGNNNDRFRGQDDSERGGGGGGGRFDDGEAAPRPPPYIPPDVSMDDLYTGGYSAGINFNKYDKIKVEVNGDNQPPPVDAFDLCDLRPILLKNVMKVNYTKPTPIQKYAIPIIKAKRDLMACAQTGSGKTAAFLLPIMHTLLHEQTTLSIGASGCVQPQCVILSPTRELAQQIYKEGLKFANETILKLGLVYGGTGTNHQMSKLQNGCHILVATPGRMLDYVNRGQLSFQDIRFVVLDEADRMLDMGFQQAIDKMMSDSSMPGVGSKNTVMFSATFPSEIQRIASKYLDNYLYVVVGMVGGACADVSQEFLQVGKFDKRKKLVEILQEQGPGKKVIVFVETKKTADFIAAFLCDSHISSTSIHGDRLQPERESAIRDFRCGKHNILVATNVAARGLDIEGVHLVINFDLPKEVDDYVHRIGRTGRVGHTGNAISFYDEQYDQNLIPQLMKILIHAEQNIPEWLQSAGGGLADFSFNSGAAHDIRSKGGAAAAVAPPADEEW